MKTASPINRLALVTGGTRGIGKAIALLLKDKGYKIVSNYYGNDKNASQFEQAHQIPVCKWNVGDYKACEQGIKEVEAKWGPIDILVNNAGITQDAMFHKMAFEQWNQVIQVNLTSCFNMARAVIEGMRERGFGRIINISSINGQKGQLGQTNYAAAKAGLIGFTKALALEAASKGVTVNAVTPGYIETDMVSAVPEEVVQKIVRQIPVARLGKPEEIANAVAFLACDSAGFITGSTLSINGGQYMS